MNRPNILCFVRHDIGKHMGCYGKPVDTPNLDAFTASAIVVDRYDPLRAVRTDKYHLIRRFDPTIKPRPWLPWETPPGDARHDGNWETSQWPPKEPRPEFELYDTELDPLEFVNLIDRPEYQVVRRDLEARLQAWQEETNDFVLREEVPQRREPPGWGPWDGRIT